jgi:hypothetical protein
MAIIAKDYWTFKEYLDAKRKLVTTPKKEDVPDYHGPKPTKPDKPAVSGDNWSTGVKPKGTPAPYKGPGTDPGQKKGEKGGFLHMGDKELVYEPDAGIVDKAGEGGTQKKTWPKVATVKHAGKKVESFLDDTKDMPLPEFAKYVQKQLKEHCGCEDKEIPHVVAYTSGPYHPDPIQAIKYVAYLANENEHLMRALLRETRQLGCVDKLVEGLLGIPETYIEIVHRMTVDPGVSNQIVRAMNDQYQSVKEGVGPPAHQDEEEDAEDPSNDTESEPDNIEGEDQPPGDDPEPEPEPDEGDEEGGPEGDTDEPAFDQNTASGGMSTGSNGLAHLNLANAIKKHKEMQASMAQYMGSY